MYQTKNNQSGQGGFAGIIFDFNGTLFWDTPMHIQAWKMISKKLRSTPFSQKEIRENILGSTNALILAYALGREPSKDEIQAVTQDKEQTYRNICLENPQAFQLAPGATELLDRLAQRNIPFTIATSSEKTNVDFYFENLPLKKWFTKDKIVYDDGTIKRGKPYGDIYQKACDLLEVRPENTIVFEDAQNGMIAANRAKIGWIVGVLSKGSPGFDESYTNQVIRDFADFSLDRFFEPLPPLAG